MENLLETNNCHAASWDNDGNYNDCCSDSIASWSISKLMNHQSSIH